MNTTMSLTMTNPISQSVNAPKTAFVNRKKAIYFSSVKTNSPVIGQSTMSRDYDSLLNKLQNDDGYYLVKYDDKSVWINTKKSEVYLDFNRNDIPGIDTASWKNIPVFNPPSSARRIQLELWLFETLWQTSVSIGKVADTGLYKLTRWPRPLSLAGRSEALRLAAFIHTEPVSIALLKSKTNYDKSMIKRFLHAALLAGQVHQIDTVT